MERYYFETPLSSYRLGESISSPITYSSPIDPNYLSAIAAFADLQSLAREIVSTESIFTPGIRSVDGYLDQEKCDRGVICFSSGESRRMHSKNDIRSIEGEGQFGIERSKIRELAMYEKSLFRQGRILEATSLAFTRLSKIRSLDHANAGIDPLAAISIDELSRETLNLMSSKSKTKAGCGIKKRTRRLSKIALGKKVYSSERRSIRSVKNLSEVNVKEAAVSFLSHALLMKRRVKVSNLSRKNSGRAILSSNLPTVGSESLRQRYVPVNRFHRCPGFPGRRVDSTIWSIGRFGLVPFISTTLL